MQFKLFYASKNKLRILEYHSISTNGFADQITIKKETLIAQFEYLKVNKYQTLWLSDVETMLKNKQSLPSKSIVLTFDDGFLDNYTELYPLLKEYDFKAVLFVVLGKIGQKIDWGGKFINENDNMRLMNRVQLDTIGTHIELGYHTFKHDNYALLSLIEIESDLKLCQEVIDKENLNVFPALAYAYGGYYRKRGHEQKAFFDLLKKYGIRYGLRIGNRINVFPLKNQYEIQRIDIRGGDRFEVFKKKVRLGRKKLF
ncbi:polysaccharide deacetylase family protein [Flavobacterium sp. 7A]|uniref:polysaccharide deacetylase family protein n=1 Tax=Flavobacterium sp. 7A TaxID=2940571 RepID=UPI00222621DA|nr:polysaccharide deacetylase family protein [Flavobacterium sp. 7A]MCW2118140.1 peptidoglycan/xylan/chitin deacetylase (PgdA/CDA1 family) [Flavobacterium sp. 7A]